MIHFHDEVISKAKEAHNGEKVDQDDGQNCSQEYGASIACHTFDDIEKCFLTVDQIKQLERFKVCQGPIVDFQII